MKTRGKDDEKERDPKVIYILIGLQAEEENMILGISGEAEQELAKCKQKSTRRTSWSVQKATWRLLVWFFCTLILQNHTTEDNRRVFRFKVQSKG